MRWVLAAVVLASLACGSWPGPPPADPAPAVPLPPRDPDREVRGVWVTRWSFTQPHHVETILDDVANAGFTHVFLQVRGRFDALYASDLEPWAAELTGTLGRDPGWDPLATAVAGAHARGLQLHAWINVYALWQGRAPRSEGVAHPLALHPDWRIADAAGRWRGPNHSYQFASPGNPAVADHVVAVVADLGERYDLDGIHLDYLRYPGQTFGHDAASLTAAQGALDFDEWRRDQIRATVARMAAATDRPLTGAVWGIHRDRWGWGVPAGYTHYFQDTYGMLADGSLEAVAPMTYWPVKEPGERLDFGTLVADHVAQARGLGEVWPGIEANKLTLPQVLACIETARQEGAAGVVIFEYTALRDRGWLDDLAQGPFAAPTTRISPSEPETEASTGTFSDPS